MKENFKNYEFENGGSGETSRLLSLGQYEGFLTLRRYTGGGATLGREGKQAQK